MLNEIYTNQKELAQRTLEALRKDFGTLRSGKVTTAILDNIMIDYYGTLTPLNQVGSVLATDATTITINPWEKPMLKGIETAIQQANIGVNPNNDGETIKLFFPPMTTEQRQESAKQARAMGEKAKISIRNVRKDSNDKVRKMEKDKELTEDESKRAQDEIQKITDDNIEKIDLAVKEKESELMKV